MAHNGLSSDSAVRCSLDRLPFHLRNRYYPCPPRLNLLPRSTRKSSAFPNLTQARSRPGGVRARRARRRRGVCASRRGRPHAARPGALGAVLRAAADERATYAEKIAPADRELDLDARGRVAPSPGALAAHRRVGDLERPPRDDLARAPEAGRLVPELVQPEGRNRMSYDEYLRGLR